MPATFACIAGEEIYRQWNAKRIAGQSLGQRRTPFGVSGDIFLTEGVGESFYLLCRHGLGMNKVAPYKVNDRANIYALKDLGVQMVLGWDPGGAITHNIAVGDLVILSDVIDFTNVRPRTFFENSPLGFLRQFPVFCPSLRNAAAGALNEMKLVHHGSGIAAVCEGPRLETPAEVRMLATAGAEVVSHTFTPEVFLAKELQLCYAAICYVVNYAETGSRHRPFAVGDLFGGLTQKSDTERLTGVCAAMGQIVAKTAQEVKNSQKICDCDKTMTANVREYKLSDDWRKWFV